MSPVDQADLTGTTTAEVIGWMDAARNGDRAAFGRIYQRYQDKIFRYAYYRLGDRHRAQDLTHDVFIRALKNIDNFHWQGRDPGAWFMTITKNLVADHVKSGRYRLEVTTDDVARAGDAPSTIGDPVADTLAYLDAKQLDALLLKLSDEQREVLILRFFRGLDVRETAQAMGKHEGAIKALQFRATRSMARLMAGMPLRRPGRRPAPVTLAPVVLPGPRRPEPDPEPAPLPADEPELTRRIAWRCATCTRRYAQPYANHGAPTRCGGWLEVVELTGATS
jgi:RNA polymerase sigma factor (sigma-70 family)